MSAWWGDYAGEDRAQFVELTRMTSNMTINNMRDELLGDVPYAVVDTPDQREKRLHELCTRNLMIGSYD